MSAESAKSERVRRASASSCPSTVVLTLTRAMPLLYHMCATTSALRARRPLTACVANVLDELASHVDYVHARQAISGSRGAGERARSRAQARRGQGGGARR